VERHLVGRRGQAFALAVAASLIRPEAWPFLGAYAIWLWIKEPRLRVALLAGLAAVPVFWFVPPWIGSGQPFLAASHAKAYNGHLGRHPALEALRRAGDLQVLPVLIAAAIAAVFAWLTDRSRLVLALCGGVLAGVGIARLAGLAGGGYATIAAAAGLVAISVPLSTSRIDSFRAQKPLA